MTAHAINTQSTDHFLRIYRSFLKDGGKLRIDQIIGPYAAMKPALHPGANSRTIDFPAFLYCSLRLPEDIGSVQNVILTQSDDMFVREGYTIDSWKETTATARRRKMLYDGLHTLGVFINSVTDVDDIVCLLTAYSVEWNKIHAKLIEYRQSFSKTESVRDYLGVVPELWEKFEKIWGKRFTQQWQEIAEHTFNPEILLLRGSYVDYSRTSQQWFYHIQKESPLKTEQNKSVYFVSSNTHSIVNSVTGFVNEHKNTLLRFIRKEGMDAFLRYYEDISSGKHPGSEEHFLWYILKKYEQNHPSLKRKRWEYERALGIHYVEASHYLDINAQVIELSALAKSPDLNQKLGMETKHLRKSSSVILNIDYPLGMGAYMVLSTVLRNIKTVRGVYILGKASFLHGNLGDIGLPTTIYDEYSGNTIMINNAFTRKSLSRFQAGNVLENQKLVSVKGTLLHPESVIRDYFSKGFSIIEMENGSYLNAISEGTRYSRYPENSTLNLLRSSMDIGIINYASDTPFTKAVTLATRNLGYDGVEATYESSIAILRRIVEVETAGDNLL